MSAPRGKPRAKRKTCRRSHPLAPPNLVEGELSRGVRMCRACDLARQRVRYAAEHGRVLDLKAVADKIYAKIMKAAA